MDFALTPEQQTRRAEAEAFARTHLGQGALVDRERESRFDRDGWEAAATHGLLRMSVPEEYGGAPTDLLTAMLVMEGLGRGCPDNGLVFALNAQLWTTQLPIVEFGTEDQKQRYLPSLCTGERIAAHALTEESAGSDVFSLRTHARPAEGGYRLDGAKRLITLGPVADVFLVFATVAPERGKWGVTAFLVDRATEGLTVHPTQEKMGLRTVPLGRLTFADCFVPESARLGPEGAGVSIATHCLETERCCILAGQLGAMERQLERAVEHARTREQFGQPIGRFQSVANRLVDMRLRLETARLLLYKVAWMKEQGQQATLEAALLKLHLGESFVHSSLDAIRVHGGDGYLTEFGIERDLRDAVGGVLYAGTSDIQRTIVARLMGL